MSSSKSFFFSSSKLNSTSNIVNFLRSVTPFVRSKPTLQIDDLYTQTSKPITEHFTLGDLWICYEKPSVYGLGTPLILDNGEIISQYYIPYLSALQLFTKSSSDLKNESVVVEFESDSCSDDSDSEKLSRSSSNNSSKGWDSCSVDSSIDTQDNVWTGKDQIGDLYFKYFDNSSPHIRIPLMEKIGILYENNPGIMNLNSTDISLASWMAIAWYPIFTIPNNDYTEGLLGCFLTYHKISAPFQETPWGDDEEWISKYSCDKLESAESRRERRRTGRCSNEICVPPFGLASYRVDKDVWKSEGSRDLERLKELNGAADSWLKQMNVNHHEFNLFNAQSAMESTFTI